MKLTVSALRKIVRDVIVEAWYDPERMNSIQSDDAWKQTSLLVPDDVKVKLQAWYKKMQA